jgi:hypothetical protein
MPVPPLKDREPGAIRLLKKMIRIMGPGSLINFLGCFTFVAVLVAVLAMLTSAAS